MSAPEDRYCSSCGFGDYCMRERSCYRRDQGEIRSVYLIDPVSAQSASHGSGSGLPSQFDPGASRHGSRSGLRAQANTSKAKAQPPRRMQGCAASAPPKGGKSHNA